MCRPRSRRGCRQPPAPQDSSTQLPGLGGVAGDVGIPDCKSSIFKTGYSATPPIFYRQSAYSALFGGYSATPRGVAVAFRIDAPGGTQLLSRRCRFWHASWLEFPLRVPQHPPHVDRCRQDLLCASRRCASMLRASPRVGLAPDTAVRGHSTTPDRPTRSVQGIANPVSSTELTRTRRRRRRRPSSSMQSCGLN